MKVFTIGLSFHGDDIPMVIIQLLW